MSLHFRHSFQADVRFCAQQIFCDLAANGIPRSLSDLRQMCARFGKTVLVERRIPPTYGGHYDGQEIYVSYHLTCQQFYEAIPHELVHALSYTTRWAWLNDWIEGWHYDKNVFVEAVARMVGKMFAHQLTA